MTDLAKLTAKDFSDAMHKGWKSLNWCDGFFFLDAKKKTNGESPEGAKYACAVGAMAYGLQAHVGDVLTGLVEMGISSRVITASNDAGNKRAAMKAVDAILLNTPAVRGGAK
jgi:hypothetical protein